MSGVKLTKADWHVLKKLDGLACPVSSGVLAHWCDFRTQSPRETAARHVIKLVKAGMAEKHGTRMFPTWAISPAGRLALSQGGGE